MRRDRVRNIHRSWMAAVMVMMLALAGAVSASAAGAYPQIDASKPVTLEVHASYKDAAISDLRFTLYKVADMAVDGKGIVDFTLTAAFEDLAASSVEFGLDPDDMDSGSWASGAQTLAAYVPGASTQGGHSFEMISSVTGADGVAKFAGLSQGLYLMTNSYAGSAYSSVSVTPVYLTLPNWSESGNAWVYQSAVNAKVTAVTNGETPEKTTVTVRKAWSGDDTAGTSSRRPASIEVELLDSNSAVRDTKTLSAQNGWQFTWENLDAGDWTVREKTVPSQYSVSQTEETTAEGKLVTITNTTPPAGVQGESREKTSETEKGKKGVKGSSRQGDTASVESASRLPQTGQLWWPVWLLAGIAAVCLIIGLILRLSGGRDLKDR
ncbi:MAG: Cna B-type domain-containing protein [Lachnospiraceae bacterium]|nr:Cna B-type domain-containing protein [Lachnospiraceae bacterium]